MQTIVSYTAAIYPTVRDRRYRKTPLLFADPAFALGIQRVINNKFAFENFVVGEPERSEATGNPAQTFSGRMRIRRMRISRAYNLAQQNERWIG
jgi:hypothetical protein